MANGIRKIAEAMIMGAEQHELVVQRKVRLSICSKTRLQVGLNAATRILVILRGLVAFTTASQDGLVHLGQSVPLSVEASNRLKV